jgi:type IV pilus assembly protein PilB
MTRPTTLSKKKVGEILLEEGLLKDQDVIRILNEQLKTHEYFGEIAIRLGLVAEDDILRCLVKQMDIPYLDIACYDVNKPLIKDFPELLLRRYMVTPVDKIGLITVVAVSGPMSQDQIDALCAVAKNPVQYVLSRISSIKKVICEVYPESEESLESKGAELTDLGSMLLKETA